MKFIGFEVDHNLIFVVVENVEFFVRGRHEQQFQNVDPDEVDDLADFFVLVQRLLEFFDQALFFNVPAVEIICAQIRRDPSVQIVHEPDF